MEMVRTEDLVFEYAYYNEDTPEASATGDASKSVALDGVSIKINKGEFVAILGHNGSGKSTLAKHMNALLIPTGGTIWINGFDTRDEKNIWNVRQSAGMVFQNPDNQIIATIVEEDIAFGPENLGVPSAEIRTRVDGALKAVTMEAYAGHSPHFLSGGQKQRVAIAGVLAMKPECIVLDEPTAMLDPSGRKEVIDTVTRLNKDEGITIILITHFMEEAVAADRVVVMENGKVVMDDVPKRIFSQLDKMKALGLDVPQVTELAISLKRLGINIGDDVLTIDEMVGALCRLKSS